MKEIEENGIKIIGDDVVTKKSNAFYNKDRANERTLNVQLIKLLASKNLIKYGSIGLDLLSATGIRGIRLFLESGVFNDFILNDVKTSKVIEHNLKINNLNLKVESKDARKLIIGKFDYIDIDPFGSPLSYLSAAILNSKLGTILGITATDTAALYGSAPKAAIRKYFAQTLKTSYYNEEGLRILLYNIERIANIYNFSIEPICYLVEKHYLRVYVRLTKYRRKEIGYIYQCINCPNRSFEECKKCDVCGGEMKRIGPLWLETTINKDITRNLSNYLVSENYPYSTYFLKEQNEIAIPWYFTTDEIAKYEKKPEKKLTLYLKFGNPTPLNPKGFKTTLSFKEILSLTNSS
ncbi:MAG: hypothetical protein QXJ93_01155 [Candidatus Rehaiarchaeum fermentans]|nr:hypothetical protein [Candidatus Rehaiarchaeum fermentans]